MFRFCFVRGIRATMVPKLSPDDSSNAGSRLSPKSPKSHDLDESEPDTPIDAGTAQAFFQCLLVSVC